MYSNIFLLLYLFGALHKIINIICGLGIAAIIITTVIHWLYYAYLCDERSDKKAIEFLPKAVKWLKRLWIIAIFIAILSFNPTQKQVVTFFALKQVDNYNERVEDSTLRLDTIFEVVDVSLKKVTVWLDNIEEAKAE